MRQTLLLALASALCLAGCSREPAGGRAARAAAPAEAGEVPRPG